MLALVRLTPLLSLLGCAPLPAPEGLPALSDYSAAHAEATRELRLVRQLETRLLLRATWVSPALAEAQALTLAHTHRDGPTAYKARLVELTEKSASEMRVVFAADDPAGRESFAFDDDADWTLHLLVDGVELAGSSLERLDASDPDMPLLYPQLNRWSTLWEARFEGGPGSDVRLEVGGARGQGTLSWTDSL